MPRPLVGERPMTPAERMARSRNRQAARIVALAEALQHVADGIANARECGAHWSQDQRQAWLNGLEAVARRAL